MSPRVIIVPFVLKLSVCGSVWLGWFYVFSQEGILVAAAVLAALRHLIY